MTDNVLRSGDVMAAFRKLRAVNIPVPVPNLDVTTTIEASEEVFYGAKLVKLVVKGDNIPGTGIVSGIKLGTEVTNNCQMTTLGGAHAITHAAYTREQTAKALKLVCDKVSTLCALADVLEDGEHHSRFMQAIEDNKYRVIVNTPYTNTTGTRLALVYFVINEPADEEDEEFDEDWEEEDDY